MVGSLEQLDDAQLDAEQQFRVRRIIASFRARIVADVPDQIAAKLFLDPLIWLALLDRPEKATRAAAAKQLAALLERTDRHRSGRRSGDATEAAGAIADEDCRPPRRGERRGGAKGGPPRAARRFALNGRIILRAWTVCHCLDKHGARCAMLLPETVARHGDIFTLAKLAHAGQFSAAQDGRSRERLAPLDLAGRRRLLGHSRRGPGAAAGRSLVRRAGLR